MLVVGKDGLAAEVADSGKAWRPYIIQGGFDRGPITTMMFFRVPQMTGAWSGDRLGGPNEPPGGPPQQPPSRRDDGNGDDDGDGDGPRVR